MEKRKVLGVLLALLLLMPSLIWAQESEPPAESYIVELEGRYWRPKLDSTVRIVEDSIGTDVKLVDDLGFPEKDDFYEGRLQVKFLQRHKLNFSYLPLKWDADKVITRTIEFGGKTYTVGTRVQSEAKLKVFKAGFEYDFLAGKYGFLGGAFDVMVTGVEVRLKAADLRIDEKEDLTVPIPMIGLVGRIYPIKWVNLTAKISGLPLGGYGHIIDAEASININPIKYVGISGGYRYFYAKAEYDDNLMDFKLEGPFLALNIRF